MKKVRFVIAAVFLSSATIVYSKGGGGHGGCSHSSHHSGGGGKINPNGPASAGVFASHQNVHNDTARKKNIVGEPYYPYK